MIADNPVGRYDVVWTSPSESAHGSMPLGNGDIALNAWIEPAGDLRFYIGKTDSWSENGRLLKVGRIRITTDPPLDPTVFRQTLRLDAATLVAEFGEADDRTELRLWVDANEPVVHASIDNTIERAATASIELWRTQPTELPAAEVSDLLEDRSKPNRLHTTVIVEPDTIVKDMPDRIGWYHHNAKSVGPELIARLQGLTEYFEGKQDPLLHRTFGAIVTASNGKRISDTHVRSPASTRHTFSVYVLTEHPSTPAGWLASMEARIAAIEGRSFDDRRAAHEQWWREFWNRSWINISDAQDVETSDASVVSRAYALQRYMNACAGRGRYAIKFNGSIFTVPFQGRFGDADYRRWGPGYWWQNTRLPYLSMCASGDFEMMHPLFRMYATDLMPLHVFRTRRYTQHDGAFIPECMYFWGPTFTATYGWTPFEERGDDKLQQSGWHKWEWVSGPELVWMMLDYYEHTLDASFATEVLLPTAHEILTFFDQHYEVDEHGTLVMHPAQAAETWWDCTNPMPEVAGLHAVTGRLQSLPEELTTASQRAFWRRLQDKLPDLPVREVDGVAMLAPAERFADKRNVENPELYAVFPFRLVSFEKSNARLGVEALNHRWDRGNAGWRQDDLFMTHLGLAEQARASLVARARNTHADSRFPAFWGPNYDWVPDQTHGGVLMRTVQTMLMQSDDRTIHLLPAWSKDWNADFKLHAPYRTTISGSVRDGRLTSLEVHPESRRADVIVHEPQ